MHKPITKAEALAVLRSAVVEAQRTGKGPTGNTVAPDVIERELRHVEQLEFFSAMFSEMSVRTILDLAAIEIEYGRASVSCREASELVTGLERVESAVRSAVLQHVNSHDGGIEGMLGRLLRGEDGCH